MSGRIQEPQPQVTGSEIDPEEEQAAPKPSDAITQDKELTPEERGNKAAEESQKLITMMRKASFGRKAEGMRIGRMMHRQTREKVKDIQEKGAEELETIKDQIQNSFIEV